MMCSDDERVLSRVEENMKAYYKYCHDTKIVLDRDLIKRGYFCMVNGQQEIIDHLASGMNADRDIVKIGYSNLAFCFSAGFRKGEIDRGCELGVKGFSRFTYPAKYKAYQHKIDVWRGLGVPKAYKEIVDDVCYILEHMTWVPAYIVQRAFNVGYVFGVDYVECKSKGVESEYLRKAIENTKVPYCFKGK